MHNTPKRKTNPIAAAALVLAILLVIVAMFAIKGSADSYNRDADAVNAPTNTL